MGALKSSRETNLFCGGLILSSKKALSLEAGVLLSGVIPYASLGIVPGSHLQIGIKFGTDFKIVRSGTLKEWNIAHCDPLSHLVLGLNSCRRTLFSSTV